MGQLGIALTFDESAVEKTADAGFDPVYGARPLKRVIQREIEDKLSEQMLEGKVTVGKNISAKRKTANLFLSNGTSPTRLKMNKSAPRKRQGFRGILCGLCRGFLLYLEKMNGGAKWTQRKNNTVSCR